LAKETAILRQKIKTYDQVVGGLVWFILLCILVILIWLLLF